MTTLHLTRFYTPHIGGVEKHVAAVLEKLPVKNWQKIVITLQYDNKLPRHENINGVAVYRLPLKTDADKLLIWKNIWRLRHLFWQADIIHVHDVFWWLVPFYLFISRKVYLTFHGWEGQYPVPVFNQLQRFVYAQLAQGSIHVGDYIQEFYWDKPTVVVYGGVDIPTRRLKLLDWSKNKILKIVFVGRLVPENNVRSYCQVLALFKQHHIKFEMTWVGDGALANKCQNYGRVTGMIAQPSNIVSRADIVFANSYLAMLEAQSVGKLVVSLADHRLKQRYLETYPAFKTIVYGTEPKMLITEILSLLHNPELIKLLTTQGEKIVKRLTWSKMADQYQRLWVGAAFDKTI